MGGVWFLGGSFEKEGGRGFVCDFYVLLTIVWGFVSLGFFFSFSSFLSFRRGGSLRISSLAFCPFFFSFSCPFLPFLFS